MKLLSLNTLAIALVLLGVSGVIVPTGAVTGDTVDEVWDEPAITLGPADGPNGEYATVGSDGNLSVNLSGVNADSVTVVREVFRISNTESDSYEVWVSHDAEGAVELFVDGDRSLEDSGNPVALGAGESKVVSLVVDARGRSANEVLMSRLTIHAQAAATPTPTSTASGGQTSEESATPTPNDTATPDAGIEERVEVAFEVTTGDDGEPAPGEPAEPATVREMTVTELENEDGTRGPEAVIDERRDGLVLFDRAPTEPALRAVGADTLTEVGQPVNLSGTRSLIGHVDGVDSQLRIVKLVDVQVPEDRIDQPGLVRITVARAKFGATDPAQATIARGAAGGWQLLDTRVVANTDRTVTLEAVTPGFSPFAVFVQNEVRYTWTLPDGSVLQGMQISSRFDAPGLYNVSLTVTDSLGRDDTALYRILVNDRPTVAIEGLEAAADEGPATLRANVTDEFGNATVTWTFADGSTTTGGTVTREFADGEVVRVSAVDEYGAEGRAEGVIGQAPGEPGRPSVGIVQFNLGLRTRIAAVGLAIVLVVMGLRWLAARRYELG